MLSRLARTTAVLAITGLAVVGVQTAAVAQQSGSDRCEEAGAPGNAPQYPPAESRGVSDSTPERGQRVTAQSGCRDFAPGQQVAYGIMVRGQFRQLGTVTASQAGQAVASFTIPADLQNGAYQISFRGAGFNGGRNDVRIPFVITGGTVSVAGVDLPRTGSDEVVPLTALGLGLLTAGAGMVVVARRRRSDAASPLA